VPAIDRRFYASYHPPMTRLAGSGHQP